MIMTGMYTSVFMTGKCNTSMSIICQYSVCCYNIILVLLLLFSAVLVKVSLGSILPAWCCLPPNKTIPVSISSAGTKLLVGRYATSMIVTSWYATGMTVTGQYATGMIVISQYATSMTVTSRYATGMTVTGQYATGMIVTGRYATGMTVTGWYATGMTVTGWYATGMLPV